MSRKINFSAGPSTLPLSVLERIKEEIVDYKGSGFSIIEASHRGKEYEAIHNDAINLTKELLGLPNNYKVLFLGGGATLQFGMIPMNFLPQGKSADYIVTGTWSKKAFSDAKKVGKPNAIYDGANHNYTDLPSFNSLKFNNDAAYVHMCSNETIHGVQFNGLPDTGNIPLIVDMSSDFMSAPIDIKKCAMIYAGAQKNIGPAGATMAIIRDDFLERSPGNLITYLNYKTHAEDNSLHNTPPVFSIYVIRMVLEWIKGQGGLKAIEKITNQKAGYILDAIDAFPDFFKCPVKKEYRSKMTPIFRLPTEALETEFIELAKKNNMVGIKGHRSVGGIRTSIYNALPLEGAKAMGELMRDFAKNRA